MFAHLIDSVLAVAKTPIRLRPLLLLLLLRPPLVSSRRRRCRRRSRRRPKQIFATDCDTRKLISGAQKPSAKHNVRQLAQPHCCGCSLRARAPKNTRKVSFVGRQTSKQQERQNTRKLRARAMNNDLLLLPLLLLSSVRPASLSLRFADALRPNQVLPEIALRSVDNPLRLRLRLRLRQTLRAPLSSTPHSLKGHIYAYLSRRRRANAARESSIGQKITQNR